MMMTTDTTVDWVVCENCDELTPPENMHTVRDMRVCDECHELVIDAAYEAAYG